MLLIITLPWWRLAMAKVRVKSSPELVNWTVRILSKTALGRRWTFVESDASVFAASS
jgi:hypothetical protein